MSLPRFVDGSAHRCLDSALGWLHERRLEFERELDVHGAILFRGLPLESAADFDAAVGAFEYPNFSYEASLSNAVRRNRTERVFTANESPPEATIRLHHELAQTPVFPCKLFFFCEQPAEEGGATPLCRSDRLYEALARECPDFVADCEQHGLVYQLVMPPEDDALSGQGRSWRSTFGSDDRAAAETRMRSLGYTGAWTPDGCLHATTPVLPAVLELSRGRKSFFNQLLATLAWDDRRNESRRSIELGDGRPLDPEAISVAARLADRLTVDLYWQRGDLALLDNFVVMHGRRSFRGPRTVLASLVAGPG